MVQIVLWYMAGVFCILGILIETMRREGYELTVGQPQVIVKEINGKKCEPYENLVVDVPAGISVVK